MLPDLTFFLAAVPAVILVGLSKGGLGGAFALMGVPILAMAVPPMQAAAIFLPILLVMDMVALWSWRHYNDRKTLLLLLPGAVIGIVLGWATSAYISTNAMRIILGIVTLLFVLRYFYEIFGPNAGREIAPKPHRLVPATFWSTFSGYASFVAHAGGAPFQIYVLPLKLDPRTYTGTSTRYFAIVNLIKVIPYFALGELDSRNLTLSALMLPVALASTMAGAAVVRRMKPAVFYPLMYTMALIAALKLFWDGLGL
ncbi:MAG: sulfite exporter TauE/SafE family protein [Allorhizobium sp.]